MKKEITRELLERLYLKDGLSQSEIATTIGCSQRYISRLLRRFAIPTRKPGRRKTASISDDKLKEMLKSGMSQTDIARKLGISLSTMHYKVKKLNQPKSVSQKKESTKYNACIWDVFDEEFRKNRDIEKRIRQARRSA